MEKFKCISNSIDRFWADRNYIYEQKAVYLYKDTIHKIIHLERKGETGILISTEISMEVDIVSELLDFSINTRYSFTSFLRKGIQKRYMIEGGEIILSDKNIENLLIKLTAISISINLKKNKLIFVFNSEKHFDDEIKNVIFQLVDKIICTLNTNI